MALTGRIEFRSFLCCSIRNDCTSTKGWEAGGLWIIHGWPTVVWGRRDDMRGAQLSGLVCTWANWALMASNLTFSWTALATLFLSKGSETQENCCTVTGTLGPFLHWLSCYPHSSVYLPHICICFSTLENCSWAELWPLEPRSRAYPTCKNKSKKTRPV